MSENMPSNKSNRPTVCDVIYDANEIILENALTCLRHSSYPELWSVTCRFYNGLLSLHGVVGSYFLKQLAQVSVTAVKGVEAVANGIDVQYSDTPHFFSRELQMNLTRFLDQSGIVYRVYYHDETYNAQHMAQTLHISGQKVAKAVLVATQGGSKFMVLIVPGTKLVDLRRVGAILGGTDVRLATELEILEHCPGCEFGVVPVFGRQYGMGTIVDESISKQDEIVFQGDNHAEAVRLRFADYYVLEGPRIATIIQQERQPDLVS